MGAFKSLVDRARAKKEELEKQAARKAAEKAAEMAFERGKEAALAALTEAGKSLRSAGASIEDALFGPDSEAPSDARDTSNRAAAGRGEQARPAQAERTKASPAPTRPETTDADKRRSFEREVDEELAAMKRRIKK